MQASPSSPHATHPPHISTLSLVGCSLAAHNHLFVLTAQLDLTLALALALALGDHSPRPAGNPTLEDLSYLGPAFDDLTLPEANLNPNFQRTRFSKIDI